jgi:DNA-binding transcriptional LysR family regulator
MVDLRRARILREVAARGSFSEAADGLHLSQSAVSQHVATLEREVGMKLLERTRRGPRLTQAGEVLVRAAEAALTRLDEAERELAAIAGLDAGEVRVASFPSASATLLTRAVSEFTARHPNVTVQLQEAEPEESLPLLRAGELDLAVTFDYPSVATEEDPDVERVLLLTESLHLLVPRNHRLADRARVELAELRDDAWLNSVRPSACSEVVVEACRDAGFEPRSTFESDDYHVLQGFVAEGLGVTLLPDLAMPTLRSDVVVLPIAPEPPQRRVWAAIRPEGSRSPATDAMVAALREAAELVIPAAPATPAAEAA